MGAIVRDVGKILARHESLADQLKALLAYRNRPEGQPEPIKTNWTPVAANDNKEDLEGLHLERRRSMRPTELEIMESVNSGEIERNEAGQIIRIGKLRFSDGTQKERAFRYSIDRKLIEYDAPMPVGAMLGTRDRQERILGGDTSSSNAAYTAVYGGRHPNKVKRKHRDVRATEKRAPYRTKEQMRSEIAELPEFPITVYKKGFPWKPSSLRELFMGLEKGKKGESGSIAWEDISTHIVDREVWRETMAALSEDDKNTLGAFVVAKTMREIGEVNGFSGKRAERMGKKILCASNNNLAVALRKSAA